MRSSTPLASRRLVRRPGDRPRFTNIDALRGLAALLVLVLHVSEVFSYVPRIAQHGVGLYRFARYLDFGRVGVVAFFAISGFVVPATIRSPRGRGTAAFVIKRIFRLLPAFWLSVLAADVLPGVPAHGARTFFNVAAQLSMMPTFLGAAPALGDHWTLEVELVFYLLVVALFLAGCLRRRWILVCLIAILGWPAFGPWVAGPDLKPYQLFSPFIPTALSVMLWGALLRQTYDEGGSLRSTLVRWVANPNVIVATLLILGRAATTRGGSVHDIHPLLADKGVLWGELLFLLFAATPFRWPRWTVFLGTISYSLYLFQAPVFYPIFNYVVPHANAFTRQPLWFYVVLTMALTLIVATIVYVLVERPFVALARRLARRVQPSDDDQATPAPAL